MVWDFQSWPMLPVGTMRVRPITRVKTLLLNWFIILLFIFYPNLPV
jgi:hypothetical protein